MNAVMVIAKRDGVSSDEAVETVKLALDMVMEALHEGDDPEQVWMEETGLEPDYLIELM